MRPTSFHRALLLFAGLLFSLHAVVPHVHEAHYNNSDKLVITPPLTLESNWLSFLQDFFTSTDLGEDHLEHFFPNQELTLDFDWDALQPPCVLPEIVTGFWIVNSAISHKCPPFKWHFPPDSIYPDIDAPRGPPAFA